MSVRRLSYVLPDQPHRTRKKRTRTHKHMGWEALQLGHKVMKKGWHDFCHLGEPSAWRWPTCHSLPSHSVAKSLYAHSVTDSTTCVPVSICLELWSRTSVKNFAVCANQDVWILPPVIFAPPLPAAFPHFCFFLLPHPSPSFPPFLKISGQLGSRKGCSSILTLILRCPFSQGRRAVSLPVPTTGRREDPLSSVTPPIQSGTERNTPFLHFWPMS